MFLWRFDTVVNGALILLEDNLRPLAVFGSDFFPLPGHARRAGFFNKDHLAIDAPLRLDHLGMLFTNGHLDAVGLHHGVVNHMTLLVDDLFGLDFIVEIANNLVELSRLGNTSEDRISLLLNFFFDNAVFTLVSVTAVGTMTVHATK